MGSADTAGRVSASAIHVNVTNDLLSIDRCCRLVSDPGAGAISSFVGTTRDNFSGKEVLFLEYEAYVPMAIKKMEVLHPSLAAIAAFQSSTRAEVLCSAASQQECISGATVHMQCLCKEAHDKWDLKNVAVEHRTGRVLIEEASVVICVSSPHRQAAIHACHWLIDELKAQVLSYKGRI